jgi:hypothetical protein
MMMGLMVLSAPADAVVPVLNSSNSGLPSVNWGGKWGKSTNSQIYLRIKQKPLQ